MSKNDKGNLIRIRKALYDAVMNHPEAKQAGLAAIERCRPLPAKTSEHYKDAQNIQINAFINAGKILLLEAVQQDVGATIRGGRELNACRAAGMSVEETSARMLLAGVAALEAKATTEPPHVPTHARETHVLFRRVLNDDRASEQAQDISDEVDGNKPS